MGFSEQDPNSWTIALICLSKRRKGSFCVATISISPTLVLPLITRSLSPARLWRHLLIGLNRKIHVIRIRAESDQFILSCQRIETFVHWLHALSTAIDLALPLDERELPRDLSVPRHQRRLENSEQVTPEIEARETFSRDRNEARHRLRDMASIESINSITPRSGTIDSVSTRPAPNVTASIPRKRPVRPSISPETGKWQPEHGWSARKDMIYAKHCMAILLSQSPRKSNIIIMNGKQWIVNWDTGELTRREPPDYNEIDDASSINSGCRHRNSARS